MKLWHFIPAIAAMAACTQTSEPGAATFNAPKPPAQAVSAAAKLPSDPGGIVIKAKNPTFGTFSGVLAFKERGCEAKGKCTIIDKGFRFRGRDTWAVRAEYETDGASIPTFAQGVIGKPFDPSYLPAAVLHDNYCTHKVKPFLATHRAFYDMLRALGIADEKAKIMYAGVLIGGPKWFELKQGQSCGQGCIRTLRDGTSLTGDGPSRASQNTPDRKDAFEKVTAGIKSDQSRSLDEIDAQAQLLLPQDPFLALKDRSAVTIEEFDNALVIAARLAKS